MNLTVTPSQPIKLQLNISPICCTWPVGSAAMQYCFSVNGLGAQHQYTETSASDYLYQLNDEGCTILLYLGKDEYIAIPDTIDGVPVTTLAPTAFNYSNVKAVSIPDTVRIIL